MAASYRKACDWIALNDGDGDPCRLDYVGVSKMATVLLIADIFGRDPYDVAIDVVSHRQKHDKADRKAARQRQRELGLT